jgi:hypothetical protein
MTNVDSGGGAFDFGRVISHTFKVIGSNAALFGVGSLVLVGLPNFLSSIAGLAFPSESLFVSLASVVIAVVGSLVLQALVVRAAIGVLNGAPVAPKEVLNTSLRYILPLLGLGIIVAIGVLVGVLFLIVPGIIISILWSVAAPALVAEKRGVFASLQRSRDLTRGHRWAIFGLMVIYVIASIIVGVAISMVGVLGVVGSGGLDSADVTSLSGVTVLVAVVSALVNAAQGVVAAAAVSSLYYELRMAKEGGVPDQTAAVFD